MNSKRDFEDIDDVLAKRARLTDELSNDEVLAREKAEIGPPCPAKDESHDVQSHGESTSFRAITEVNGDDDSELSDFGFECFDDFDAPEGQDRQPVAGPMGWIQRHIELGTDPCHILKEMLPSNFSLPEGMDLYMMWKLIFDLLTDPQPRQKLPDINTLDQVLDLLRSCRNILVLTGAGVSVSCGIPDFRSRDGIYARLSKEYPDLPDPQAMFDIKYFRSNTKPFYKFAKEIYPGKFKPSLSHRFIHHLEKSNKLLRNYTQNIDTLEREAGITRVIECHGSFSTASCTNCKYNVPSTAIRDDILNQVTPFCPKCQVSEDTLSVMKPDIVFFGESLPQTFYDCIEQDINQVDLLIVIGSSLKVRPVNLIPNQIPANIPQILINREPLSNMNFDVELLGDCDTIIAHMCKQLGEPWSQVLQGFEIPSVPKEFLEPFLQTPPDSPEDLHNEMVVNHDDGPHKEFCDSEKNRVTESCDLLGQKENKDVPHIFLPTCRYIFHGAEIGRCNSPSPFDDDDEDESNKSDCSSEMDDKIDELNNCIEHGINDEKEVVTGHVEKNYKANYEHTVKNDPEHDSVNEIVGDKSLGECFEEKR
ncbi:NAD-dependent protein deacetylase sirtuin-1-like [Dendronephthya gigantea]|uniref:NAD-dependent protein deacetylase sirtuin-1-like n=1 Tax=Dendronephthya gigantea TaxID=151771 RepID=UPI00106C2550|nr:NAD-dependent protein deacetylase sirtuin-1-like [Dendronephthya gigantea]